MDQMFILLLVEAIAIFTVILKMLKYVHQHLVRIKESRRRRRWIPHPSHQEEAETTESESEEEKPIRYKAQ